MSIGFEIPFGNDEQKSSPLDKMNRQEVLREEASEAYIDELLTSDMIRCPSCGVCITTPLLKIEMDNHMIHKTFSCPDCHETFVISYIIHSMRKESDRGLEK